MRAAPALLMLPAALLYAGLFVGGAAYFLVISFWRVRAFRLTPDATLMNYSRTLDRDAGTLALTLGLAFAIAGAATAIGFLYAWIIRFRAGRLGPPLLFVALVTLFGGYLMKIYAWKTLLGGDGVINSGLTALGLIDAPIRWLLYSPEAVVITLTHFLLPFAVLPIFAALRGITDAEVDSARDLGAGGRRVLTDILIPRARAGITAAFALCFLVAAGDYLTPQMVGGTFAMYGQIIAPNFGSFFNWPLGAAMSFTVLAAGLLVLVVVDRGLALVGRP